jgi:hypothetical protein
MNADHARRIRAAARRWAERYNAPHLVGDLEDIGREAYSSALARFDQDRQAVALEDLTTDPEWTWCARRVQGAMHDWLTRGAGRYLLGWQDLDQEDPAAGLDRAVSPWAEPHDLGTTEVPQEVLAALDDLPRGQREAVRVAVGLDPVDSRGRDAGSDSLQRQARRGLDRLRTELSAGTRSHR